MPPLITLPTRRMPQECLSERFSTVFCMRARAGGIPEASRRLSRQVVQMVYISILHTCNVIGKKYEHLGMTYRPVNEVLLSLFILLAERDMRAPPALIMPLIIPFLSQCWAMGVADIVSYLHRILPVYVKWRNNARPGSSWYLEFDRILDAAVVSWVNRIPRLLVPRPQNLGQIMNLRSSLESFIQWSSILESIQGEFKGADSLSHVAFGRYVNTINAQINDTLISSVSRILDLKLLGGSRELFVKQAWNIWDHLKRRITLRYYCKKVISSIAASSCAFRTRDNVCMRKFMEFLRTSGRFRITHASAGVIEYSSLGLLQPAFRQQFCFLNCDDPHKFGEDYIITCFTSLQAPKGPQQEELGRYFPLSFPAGTIVVSSRNKWARVKFNLEVLELPYVQMYDASVSPDPDWNACEMESRLSFAFDCIIQQWVIHMLAREGCLQLDPHFLCLIHNFAAIMQLDVLSQYAPMQPEIERPLWVAFGRLIGDWMQMVLDLYEDGRLTALQLKLPPILRFVGRLMRDYPYEEVYERDRFERLLLRADGIVKALVRADTASGGVSDAQFCLLTVEAMLNKLQSGKIPRSEEIMVGRAIGYGASAAVYEVFNRDMGHVVALKEIVVQTQADEGVLLEMNFLRWFEHPHIVKFYGATQRPGSVYLMLEHCSGGTLLDYLRTRRTPVDDGTFRQFAIQILQGLSYLHRNNVMHGDLKPGNILIDIYDVVKLADFGATRILVDTVKGSQYHLSLGTIQYMAPETLLHRTLSLPSDIWALGCTLFHLATGRVPWGEADNPWVVLKAAHEGRSFDLAPLDGCNLQPEGIQLIRSCLRRDPRERPTAPVLLLTGYLYDTVPYTEVPINSSW